MFREPALVGIGAHSSFTDRIVRTLATLLQEYKQPVNVTVVSTELGVRIWLSLKRVTEYTVTVTVTA